MDINNKIEFLELFGDVVNRSTIVRAGCLTVDAAKLKDEIGIELALAQKEKGSIQKEYYNSEVKS